MTELQLSPTVREDLESLFAFQADPEGIYMAAFTPEDPVDKAAYLEKWSRIVENPAIRMRTIRCEGQIVGSVVHFDMDKETNVSYWIDRAYWGRGIAGEALKRFVAGTEKRPLYGRVAHDNIGSQRVLEKCGFRRIRTEKGYANARQAEITEYVYCLDA